MELEVLGAVGVFLAVGRGGQKRVFTPFKSLAAPKTVLNGMIGKK
jgi:hypothetical protein